MRKLLWYPACLTLLAAFSPPFWSAPAGASPAIRLACSCGCCEAAGSGSGCSHCSAADSLATACQCAPRAPADAVTPPERDCTEQPGGLPPPATVAARPCVAERPARDLPLPSKAGVAPAGGSRAPPTA